jgi:elongation factor G
VRAAAPSLKPALLEPIMKVRVTVPEDYMGDILGDINAKRGRVEGMESAGRFGVINALMPLAEIQRYTIDIRSITGGRGLFTMEFDHYEEAPQQEAEKVIAAHQAEKD